MFRSIRALALAAAVAVFAALPGKAEATLIGDEVRFQLFTGGVAFFPSVTETVGDGEEFLVVENFSLDVRESGIDFDLVSEGFNVLIELDFVFTNLDFSGGDLVIADVILDSVQGIGSVSFTEDSVTLSLATGDFVNTGPFASIEIITRRAGITVPEPGTLALLGLGLAGLGFARRKSPMHVA